MAAASNSSFSSFRSRALAFLALAMPLVVATACVPPDDTGHGGGPKPPTVGGGGEGGAGGDGGDGGDGGQGGGTACPENATRDCSVTLGQHGDVLSCFEGVQTCKGGQWGPCADGEEVAKPAPPPRKSGATAQVKSLSSPVDCGNNPCDPSCQTFDEVPATPVESPPQILIAPWGTGNLQDLPTALQTQGSTEPCAMGADCQFDQYCNNPSSGTCAHSKCVTGAGLASKCDPCVENICVGVPGCCTTPIQGSCSHDLCVVGPALTGIPAASACDPCVAAICAIGAFNFCCNPATGGWTQECINQVAPVCGKSCATGSWTQACVNQVKTICNAECLEDTTAPICAHDKCYIGPSLASACDPCVAQVCAVDPFCCSGLGSWDGLCLQEVGSVCGEACPTKGDCVPWLPTQTDPDCFGFDLTIGVGCTNGGALQVPVCNHGSGNAPAGLPISIFPAAPPDRLGDCYTPFPVGTVTITTPSIIAPGDCIDVTLPAGTAEGSQIGANLFLAPGYNNTECKCSNNWSIWSSATGACDSPSCAGASAYAKLKKVKLFVSVDKSLSQGCSLGHVGPTPCPTTAPTRWDQLKGAFGTFIQDPASDDLDMWLRFWPHNVGGNCPTAYPAGCGASAGCKTANADATLSTVAGETTLINAFAAITPSGVTPMFPGLEGALLAAKEAKDANPSLAPVVILVTDGTPTQCSGNGASPAPIADLASLYFNGYGIRTYIIGVDVNSTNIQIIAGSGGGKGYAIDGGDPIQTLMLDALNQIKQEFTACTLDLPDLDIFDPTMATFTYTPGAGAPMTLTQVANLAACGAGNGWYYDNPADPESVTLCPTTCTTVKSDLEATLELEIACISQYAPSTYTQKYEGVCPAGKAPQWGYLAYDTVTPGDSYVEFRVHTSDDDVTYGALSLPTTAKASPNTQVCAMGGPAPCPVDLFTALGGVPAARDRYLELEMKVYPTSDTNQTPSVNNWQVTYSCPDSE